MNYNYLRYFSVLAKVQHYTTAAARLGITQPALSSAIRSLENDLGVKLFEKAGRNVRLTEQGKYYQKRVDESLNLLDAATLMLVAGREEAPIALRVGFVSGSLHSIIAQQVAVYLQREQRCRFHLTEGSAGDLMDQLRQEHLDMAIVDVSSRDRSLHFRKLRERELCVALPAGHPLCAEKELTLSQLSPYPQIGYGKTMEDSFEDWASHPDARTRYLCHVNTAAAAITLVGAGVGIAVLPAECTLPDEAVRYLPLKQQKQDLYLCFLYNRWLDPPIWQFAEQLTKLFPLPAAPTLSRKRLPPEPGK